MSRTFAEMRGVPMDTLANEVDVKRKRKEKRDMVQAQAEAQQAQVLSQADKNTADAEQKRQAAQ